MARQNIHVTHRNDGSWAVIGAGNERASSLHRTQYDALDAGRDLAIRNRSELVIHGIDNKIRDKDSYGNDPSSIRDTKF